jgi:hypothetical protein
MTRIVPSTSAEIAADPRRLIDAMRERRIISVDDVDYTIAPTSAVVLAEAEIDEAEDMVSLRKDRTGVQNTVFVSTKGYSRHAARIKIAIDPPDSLNAAAKTASMTLHDYSIAGAYMPPHLVEQARRFIERNRAALLDYWDNKIDTPELIERLRSIANP